MTGTELRTPEELAERQGKYLAGLVWHIGAFLIINAAFWVLDLMIGQSGLQWAFWITGVWGFALAFHILAYIVDGRDLATRRARHLLEQSKRAVTPSAR